MTTNYFNDPNYIKSSKKDVSDAQGAYALREGWKRIYGEYPSTNTLAVLWAKTMLETGRFKVGFWNFNFGNIKARPGEKFTMYECGEELSLANAKELKKKDPDLVDIVKTYSWSSGQKRASVNFKPGHFQTIFRAYESIEDGAESYINFVSKKKRYLKSFEYLKAGDPVKYSYALHEAGYYTADPKRYTKTVMQLFNEFLRRKEEFLSWKPVEKPEEPKEPIKEEIKIEKKIKIEKPLIANEGHYKDNEIKIKEVTITAGNNTNKQKSGILAMVTVGVVAAWTFISQLFQSCQ